MRDNRGRLIDIIEAIDAILSRDSTREDLESVPNLQIWVLHHLQIIGEAMARITPDFRETFNEVPWQQAIGMRNIIVHGYDRVDLDIIQEVLDRDLGPLRAQISSILERME